MVRPGPASQKTYRNATKLFTQARERRSPADNEGSARAPRRPSAVDAPRSTAR